jgi:hypothetical protein
MAMNEADLYNLLAAGRSGPNIDKDIRSRFVLLVQMLVESKVLGKRQANKLLKGL